MAAKRFQLVARYVVSRRVFSSGVAENGVNDFGDIRLLCGPLPIGGNLQDRVLGIGER